jgi:hypothetical protein
MNNRFPKNSKPAKTTHRNQADKGLKLAVFFLFGIEKLN